MVLLLTPLVAIPGCGSTLQEVPVSSTPAGAALNVDGQQTSEVTPTKLTLRRGRDHALTLRQDGFADYRVDLKSGYDGVGLVEYFGASFGLGFGFVMGLGLSQMQGHDHRSFKSIMLTSLVVGAICGGVGLAVGGVAGSSRGTDYTLKPAEVNATLVPASQDLAARTGLGPIADLVERRNAHQRKGNLLYDVGRWDEAAEEFRKAYELGNNPAFLFNIAHCYRRKGDIRRAVDLYKDYLLKAPDSPRRAEIEGHIKALEQELEDAQSANNSPAHNAAPEDLPSAHPSALPVTVPPDSALVPSTPRIPAPDAGSKRLSPSER